MSFRFLLAIPVITFLTSPAALIAQETDTLYTERGYVKDFTFTDQNGKKVSLDDLRGKVWVASFFFTTCEDCRKYSNSQMAKLQELLQSWPDVALVSFSVDPEKDTTQQLKQFAKSYHADPNRWLLLSGPQDDMYQLIEKSFEQAVGENPSPEPGAEYFHSFKYMVVDQRGKIRGYLDVREYPERVPEIADRVKNLVQAKYLPTINASLNGLCGVLLVLGYIAVRRRRIGLHKVLMLSALAVSAIFLACYLYYHFFILQGHSTKFGGEGSIRIVYFSILISHTVLAALVAPLALYTSWLGIRDKLQGHVRIAKWTLPLWLYVSVTGVVVYWMLYHLYSPL